MAIIKAYWPHLAILFLAFSIGWLVNGWRQGAKVAECTATAATETAGRATATTKAAIAPVKAVNAIRQKQKQENARVEDLIRRRAYFDAQ